MSSIICTTHTAAFDAASQLITIEHYLINSHLNYTQCFPGFSLYFPLPPVAPYIPDLAAIPDEMEQGDGKKTKKRKLDNGIAWESERVRSHTHALSNPVRSRIDKATQRHHEEVCRWLKDAWSGIRAIREGKGVGGGQVDGVIWREKGESGASEVDWVGLLGSDEEKASANSSYSIDKVEALDRITNRIITNSSDKPQVLSFVELRTVKVVLPVCCSFLLSDFADWSKCGSIAESIAEFGRSRGGWDLVVIEYVVFCYNPRLLTQLICPVLHGLIRVLNEALSIKHLMLTTYSISTSALCWEKGRL